MRALTLRSAVAVAALAALAACTNKGKQPVVGGLGTPLALAKASDMRVSPDGHTIAYLVDGEKPRLDGVPPLMLQGELHVVSASGGAPSKVGAGVCNAPGGYLFSPDSRWLLMIGSYNVAGQVGEGLLFDLTNPSAGVRRLGANVSYLVASPDSKTLAVVDGGVLKVGPIEGANLREISGEVSTALFSPDNKHVLFKRRVSAAGGLFVVPVAGGGMPIKLGEQVGDVVVSADGQQVAFSTRSDVVHSTYDLWMAGASGWKSTRIASGTTVFAFSPDGKYFARTEGAKPEQVGDLYVGPPNGQNARKIGDRVQAFEFAPNSSAIAYLENWVQQAPSWGKLTVTTLPDGAPKKVGGVVPSFTWSSDGKWVAYLARFFKPVYSVDLMLFSVEGPADGAFKVRQGVFAGYGFTPRDDLLLFRSNCIREGRACDLFKLDLARPKDEPQKLVEGIYNYKLSGSGDRVLLNYARIELGDLFDTGVYNLKSGERKTLQQYIQLPAVFLDANGDRVAYVVAQQGRRGVYVSDKVP